MTTKMKDKDVLCKFQNTGYCKYQDKCKFKHVKEKCEGNCDRKVCQQRHPRPCKFSFKCKRQNSCEYEHHATSDETSLKAEIKRLTAIVQEVVEENKMLKEKMAHLELELTSNVDKIVKENHTLIRKALEENKTTKTKMVNLEKEFKSSPDKINKERDNLIEEVREEQKVIETKIINLEKDLKSKSEKAADEKNSTIEKVVQEYLNNTIKKKVVSMENSMKTAVEKIVKEIKDLKMENNKTAKEIKSMKEKAEQAK